METRSVFPIPGFLRQPNVRTRVSKRVLVAFRELRLHHWDQALVERSSQYHYELHGPSRHALQCQARANFHIKQVQLLNEFFPLGDTAETDANNRKTAVAIESGSKV